MPQPSYKRKSGFTYSDYLTWPEEERWEIIHGEAYNMTPAPSRRHQQLSGRLFTAIFSYLQGKSCEVYNAPFDVRLPAASESDEEIETVVQPDIVVVCDKNKLDDQGCKGAPDLIVEIASPNTVKRDLVVKRQLYEQAGVREYWVVFPLDNVIQVFCADADGKYGEPTVFAEEDVVAVQVLEGLTIALSEIFRI